MTTGAFSLDSWVTAGSASPAGVLGPGLITPAMLARLRAIGERGLVTTVTLLKRVVVEGPYGDDVESWADAGDYAGWLRSMNTARLTEMHDLQGTLGMYRLNLHHSADAKPGDQVAVLGEIYEVQDSNSENSVRVFTTLTLRRIQ